MGDPKESSIRARTGWIVASLPAAPLAAVLYFFFEWLFFVTKPSPTAGLTVGMQLLVLFKSPLPVLGPLLAVQAVATLFSLVAYPRFRGVACVPAAVVLGFLAFVLIDNFTYTVFSVGIVRSGEAVRIAYAVLVPMLAACAGWKLCGWLTTASRRRGLAAVALSVTVAFASVQALSAVPLRPSPPTGPAADLLPSLEASKAGSEGRPNILFLGVDGLDASILSAYGYERPTTPFLESIRDETLFFENAFSNAPKTHGSLVTLLTGRLPFSTHVTFPPTLLQGEDAHRTLPALLKQLGYSTLQLGMRHYADAEDTNVSGFDAANYRWQNLEEIRLRPQQTDETDVFRNAVLERIHERLGRLFGMPPVADAFAHVEGRQIVPQWRDQLRVDTLVQYFHTAPEPWFVHLHLLDTHCCTWKPDHVHFSGGPANIDARDSQIVESDANIRRLFDALEASGRLERTIVVVSSDHASQWRTTERVPLMMRFPHRAHSGHVSANVQLADVAPTMLENLGVAAPRWMDGTSLLDAEPVGARTPHLWRVESETQ